MNFKKMALSFGMLGALSVVSFPLFAHETNDHPKERAALLIKITPEDVKGLEIKDVNNGGVEMKVFSIARKKIKPGMARVALKKLKANLKSDLKPGEEVVLGVGVVANGKAEACKLKLTMGKHHKFSQVQVEECDVFKGADIKQKHKKIFIVLKKV